MVKANSPDGYNSDTTNLESKDGEKTDTMSKRTLKTNIMCVKVKLVVSMNKHSNVY